MAYFGATVMLSRLRSEVSSTLSRGAPTEMSNFDCLPGKAGGTPFVLVLAVGHAVRREFGRACGGAFVVELPVDVSALVAREEQED